MSGPTGYTMAGYGDMIADPSRAKGYVPALRKAVFPGCTVVDIGSGPGFFAILCCKYGAARVYAIEPDTSLAVGREIARQNGCLDKIEFIQDISTKAELPERADIIVSDLRGILPLFQNHIPSIVDARTRFLRPGGRMIPSRDTLWASLIEDPAFSRENPWTVNDFGVDLEPGRKHAVNIFGKTNAKPEQLLLEPLKWQTVDYTTVVSPAFDGTMSWTCGKQGTAHGVIVWFEADLGDGFGYSNRPGEPELLYGQKVFVLEHPVLLEVGDEVELRLAANLIGGKYIWRWDTRVRSGKRPGEIKADYKQSDFYGTVIQPADLQQFDAGHVPVLSRDAELKRMCLNLADGNHTLGEIAQHVSAAFPDRFPEPGQAVARVSELILKQNRA